MLHVGILPGHTAWHDFFRHLRYVVIDEIHTYRGVFGSHVANVLRRLRRVCAFYGVHPQFICTSATIANPAELAGHLVGEPVTLISENGAPRGERHMVFYDPPVVDAQLGVRRPALQEARALAGRLLAADVQTVVFCRSRRAVEQMVVHLRQEARRAGRDPAVVRGYRGGYLRDERRAIEAGLRSGAVRAVAATNALEVGVDIGGLEACIMAGYPGTIAATWQQAGRGRPRRGAQRRLCDRLRLSAGPIHRDPRRLFLWAVARTRPRESGQPLPAPGARALRRRRIAFRGRRAIR
jgi:DEAD/DEAH box helicase domain-containing protein